MSNQAITVTKILAVYEQIKRAQRMADIVTMDELKTRYKSEAMGMWNALDLMLGNNDMVTTINQVVKLEKLRAIKAA